MLSWKDLFKQMSKLELPLIEEIESWTLEPRPREKFKDLQSMSRDLPLLEEDELI
jgi:hypothetical protein